MNVNNNNREYDVKTEDVDNKGEDVSGDSNITKDFDAMLKDIKSNRGTTKLISVKSCFSNINLYPLIIKLLDAEKTVLEKEYGFDEVFNIFYKIDNKGNKLNEYNSRAPNKIDTKNVVPEYLKIIEDKLINMFSTPAIIRKINNAN